MKWIDLRSDTVTAPTPEMREAMFKAEIGDDVYRDDPTVNRLEQVTAERLGKEAALFVPSGTFGNQLAILTHCRRGDEILLGEDCHIFVNEVGAPAVIAGVQVRPFQVTSGRIDPAEIQRKIRGSDIHFPDTGLICLENALSDGRVVELDNMRDIHGVAKAAGIPVHLDGARIFNAAVALSVDAAEIAACCDSVMVCLSKGLCAPIGSLLAGTAHFIARARKGRKIMGGGLRQAGFLAAAGLIAIEKMPLRLQEDHDNAKYLGAELAKIDGLRVLLDRIQINMVFIDIGNAGISGDALKAALSEKGVKISPVKGGLMRFVTNNGVDRKDLDLVAGALREILAGK